MEPAIRLAGLTKRYGAARGIEDVSLHVHRGEVFGFLGPNGAGKSTTIKCLLDLIRPTGGTAHVLGLNAQTDSVKIQGRVGYLPGEFALYEKMTGEAILRHYDALRGGGHWARARDIATRLECDLTKRVRELSRGNKQKLGIVQALMHAPELAILDEPTSGLDPLMQQEFNKLIHEVRAEGRTVFLSSHILTEVERVCGRVGIIRNGRLIAVDDVASLRTRAARRYQVEFALPVSAAEFQAVAGIADVEVQGTHMSCTLAGSAHAFVQALARHEVVRFESVAADLESVFLGFYNGDSEAPA